APLPYDPATMAPMGCLPGDLNEDGLADLLVYYWGRTPVAFLRQKAEGEGEGSKLGASSYVRREVVGGPEQRARWFTNAGTLADLDGDGHADLVVGNYFPDGARILDAKGTGGSPMPRSMSRAFNSGRKHLLLWARPGAGPDGGPDVRYVEAEGAL